MKPVDKIDHLIFKVEGILRDLKALKGSLATGEEVQTNLTHNELGVKNNLKDLVNGFRKSKVDNRTNEGTES